MKGRLSSKYDLKGAEVKSFERVWELFILFSWRFFAGAESSHCLSKSPANSAGVSSILAENLQVCEAGYLWGG